MAENTSKQNTYRNREPILLDIRDWALFISCIAMLSGAVVSSHRNNPSIVNADIVTEFSEARTRSILENLNITTKLSALTFFHSELIKIQKMEKNNLANVGVGIQVTSRCFELEDMFSPTCDLQSTSIVLNISTPTDTPRNTLIVACKIPFHSNENYDTVSCSVLLDLLRVFAHNTMPLPHDVVSIFYAGEESVLDGVQRLLPQFVPEYNKSAVLILENTGFNRREILFHANSWLHQIYLKSAPHRLPNALILECLQGVWDNLALTYFRDQYYADVSLLSVHQVGFVKHGWTGQKTIAKIGAIQRAGEDILALMRAILVCPTLSDPSNIEDRIIFNEFFGFLISYSHKLAGGFIIGYPVLVSCYIFFIANIRIRKRNPYPFHLLRWAFLIHYISSPLMALTSLLPIAVTMLFDLTNYWYTHSFGMLLLHIIPILLVGINVHKRWHTSDYIPSTTEKGYVIDNEWAHYDTSIVITGTVTLCWGETTPKSFFLVNYVIVLLIRELLIRCLLVSGTVKKVTPKFLMICQFISHIPIITSATFFIMFSVENLDLLVNRFGDNVELVMGIFSFLVASSAFLCMHNLIYISKRAVIDIINITGGISVIILSVYLYYSSG